MWKGVLAAVAVCAVALCVRLPYLWTLLRVPSPLETENVRVADALAHGDGWANAFGPGEGPTAHVAPLYPLVLSGLYRLCGDFHTVTGRFAQQCLSVTLSLCVLLLLPVVARKLGLPAAAGWAGALVAALSPDCLWDEVMGCHEQVVGAVALLGMVWMLADLHESGWSGRRRIAAAGALLGLCALACPNLLLIPVLFIGAEWARWGGRRMQIARCAAGLALIAALFVAPWALRNYVVLGGFVPLRSNLGLELAVGNRPGADGHTYAEGFGEMHPFCSAAQRDRLFRMGELAYMKDKQRQATAWIAGHPAEFVGLTLRRMFLFWFSPRADWRPYFQWHLRVCFDVVMGGAALLELFRLWRIRHPALRLLVCTLAGAAAPYFVTHVEMRYRLPVVGPFALLMCDVAFAVALWAVGKLRRPAAAPPTTEAQAPSRAA